MHSGSFHATYVRFHWRVSALRSVATKRVRGTWLGDATLLFQKGLQKKKSHCFQNSTGWVCEPFQILTFGKFWELPQVSVSRIPSKLTVDSSRTGKLHLRVTCHMYVLRPRSTLLKLSTLAWAMFTSNKSTPTLQFWHKCEEGCVRFEHPAATGAVAPLRPWIKDGPKLSTSAHCVKATGANRTRPIPYAPDQRSIGPGWAHDVAGCTANDTPSNNTHALRENING